MEKYPLPLANPTVRQAYDAQAPEFELARELIAARTQAGLTPGEVDPAALSTISFKPELRPN